MGFETVNVEFKSRFTEEIYKEVIAFANTDGGIIHVGIDNEGNAIGLADVDDEYTALQTAFGMLSCRMLQCVYGLPFRTTGWFALQ